MDTSTDNSKIQTSKRYYIKYNNEEIEYFFTGITFFGVAKWSNDFEEVFLFNHAPRKFEIEDIIAATPDEILNKCTLEIFSVMIHIPLERVREDIL